MNPIQRILGKRIDVSKNRELSRSDKLMWELKFTDENGQPHIEYYEDSRAAKREYRRKLKLGLDSTLFVHHTQTIRTENEVK